jgi:hypothetical protein
MFRHQNAGQNRYIKIGHKSLKYFLTPITNKNYIHEVKKKKKKKKKKKWNLGMPATIQFRIFFSYAILYRHEPQCLILWVWECFLTK